MKERWLTEHDDRRAIEPLRPGPGGPVEPRHFDAELLEAVARVTPAGVARLGDGPLRRRQLGFERQQRSRVSGRLRAPDEREDPQQVGFVCGADRGIAWLGVQVVIAIGQERSTLSELHGQLACRLRIAADDAVEEAAVPARRQASGFLGELSRRRDGLDTRQLPPRGIESRALDPFLVRDAVVEVRDLAAVWLPPLGVDGDVEDDGMQVALDLRCDFLKRAVEDAVVGNGGGREPCRVDVREEVVLRSHRPVERREVESGLRGRLPRQRCRSSGDRRQPVSEPHLTPFLACAPPPATLVARSRRIAAS